MYFGSCFVETFFKGGLEETPNAHRVHEALGNVKDERVQDDDNQIEDMAPVQILVSGENITTKSKHR